MPITMGKSIVQFIQYSIRVSMDSFNPRGKIVWNLETGRSFFPRFSERRPPLASFLFLNKPRGELQGNTRGDRSTAYQSNRDRPDKYFRNFYRPPRRRAGKLLKRARSLVFYPEGSTRRSIAFIPINPGWYLP